MQAVKYEGNDYFKLPNPGLDAYLKSNVKGSDVVVRTPLFKGQDPQEVVDRWMNVLRGELSSNSIYDGLITFEEEMRSKVGPLSCRFSLKERLPQIEEYYKYVDMGDEVDERYIAATVQNWLSGSGRLNLASVTNVVNKMRKNTNSGVPFFTKREKALKQSLPFKIDGQELVLTDSSYKLACVLGWRGQEGGPSPRDVKQRTLWMFPMNANILEGRVYVPLIEYAQRNGIVAPWLGNNAVDARMTQLFKTKARDQVVIATDFTAFDQHVNLKCQTAVRHALSYMFNDVDQWLNDIFPLKYELPLILDGSRMLTGVHGMGSGSEGTNADETVLHSIFQYEAAVSNGSELNDNSMCLGDDGVITYPGINVDSLITSYTRHGVEMNAEKQWVSDHDTVFLKRWHSQDYLIKGIAHGVYSTSRALGKLMFMERWHEEWDENMVLLRTLAILNNVKWHPLREQFASFCIKGDKYLLGLRKPSMFVAVKRLLEHGNDQIRDVLPYTQTITGEREPLEQWWIVKWLRRNGHLEYERDSA